MNKKENEEISTKINIDIRQSNTMKDLQNSSTKQDNQQKFK